MPETLLYAQVLAITKTFEDVADGVISTDNVFEAVTNEVELVFLGVLSVAVITCKTVPVVIAAGNAVTAPKDALAILPWGIVPDIAFAPPS